MHFYCLLIFIFLSTTCYSYKKAEEVGYEVIGRFFKKQSKLGLLEPYGQGGSLDHETWKKSLFAIRFKTKVLSDISSARKIFVKTLNEFITEINNTPDIEKYVIEYPVTPNLVDIAIIGESKNGLFSISNIKNKIFYSKDGDFESTITVHEETLEEALKIIADDNNV